jgi:signal peptidase II
VQAPRRRLEVAITHARAIGIILFCFTSDQLIKLAVRYGMPLGDSVAVLGDWVRLTHVENRNAVMGLPLLPMWALATLSLVAIVVIGVWLWRQLPSRAWLPRLLPWVLGGAVGNAWDRVVRGGVTDMFDVDIPDLHLPAFELAGLRFGGFFLDRWWVFNLADSFIFVSLLLVIGLSLAGKLEDEDPAARPAGDSAPNRGEGGEGGQPSP